jgi:Major Facilitator Superfamily
VLSHLADLTNSFNVTVPQVALTTGLFMMGMGVGGALVSPTAIIIGKRPVYLFCCLLLIGTSIWCALSKSYGSLLIARIIQGMAVSPVEVLPSATIVEIFFLHERAGRIGIYEFLYLGGKNLVPLIAAGIVKSLGWRWIFWIVVLWACVCFTLLFLFVPETFWERTPTPRKSFSATIATAFRRASLSTRGSLSGPPPNKKAEYVDVTDEKEESKKTVKEEPAEEVKAENPITEKNSSSNDEEQKGELMEKSNEHSSNSDNIDPIDPAPKHIAFSSETQAQGPEVKLDKPHHAHHRYFHISHHDHAHKIHEPHIPYTAYYRTHHPKTFTENLKLYNGRLSQTPWWKIALRPFILYAYPAVLWSAAVYSLSIGWLIVISESVSLVYRNKHTYNFSSLSAGLVYVSPFIGSIAGTIGGGEVSDVIIKAMARRNGGVYEPEFRLLMAVPVTLCTVIGLFGFGWSAQVVDAWIVPTVFFGILSFGCALGASTAVTFCVDSYRQYAGEALVTLNFSKSKLAAHSVCGAASMANVVQISSMAWFSPSLSAIGSNRRDLRPSSSSSEVFIWSLCL